MIRPERVDADQDRIPGLRNLKWGKGFFSGRTSSQSKNKD
jgi:hypothetical protein